MLRVTALYPNTAGGRFDPAYYTSEHRSLAEELLRPHGLTELRITIGVAALDGAPPPFAAVSELVFTDRAAFDAAMAEAGAALFADAAKYTDLTPILQLSDLR